MLPSRSPVWSRWSRRHLLAAAALAAAALTPAALALAPLALATAALAAAALALAAAALAPAICLHINRPDVGGWARRVPVSRRRSRKHPQRRGERRCAGRRPSIHVCVYRCD